MNVVNKFWINVGIGCALVLIFIFTVDLSTMLENLAGANYWLVALSVLLYQGSLIFRTIRWQVLLRHMKFVSLFHLYPVVVIGYMANNLLPMRLGELVRSYYLGEREGVSKVTVLTTIVVERVMDALTLLMFIALIAIFVPLAGVEDIIVGRIGIEWYTLAVLLSTPFVTVFCLFVLIAYYPERAARFLDRILDHMSVVVRKKFKIMFVDLLNGLRPLSAGRTLVVLFVFSLPIWLLDAMLFFLIGLSFELNTMYANIWHMAIAMLLVTAISNIGGSIPAAPGGVGLFDLIAREVLVLIPLGFVDRSVAAAYVAVVHVALVLPVILLGQVFLWNQNISFGHLLRNRNSIFQHDPNHTQGS